MNRGGILLGGIVGGIVFNIVAFVINGPVLGTRFLILRGAHVLRENPRGPFMPVYPLLIFAISIALVWLYAAARPRLGPGPATALKIGIVAGLIGSIPSNFAEYSWAYTGGYVAMWWTIQMVAGCALATFFGAWVYKEKPAAGA